MADPCYSDYTTKYLKDFEFEDEDDDVIICPPESCSDDSNDSYQASQPAYYSQPSQVASQPAPYSSQSYYSHPSQPAPHSSQSYQPTKPVVMSEKELGEKKKIWDAYPKVEQPDTLTVQLFPHQLVTVYNMEKLEREREIKVDSNTTFLTEFGILGDLPGYGKSFSVVSLIIRDQMKWDINSMHETTDIYTYNSSLKVKRKQLSKKQVRPNLIVASPTLIEQWKEYFSLVKPGTLQIKEISTTKDIPSDNNVFCSANWDVVLVSSVRFNQFIDAVGHNITWKRFIFDEAGSTHISSMRTVSAGFTWFVTATYIQLKYCSGTSSHYLKSFFNSIDSYVLKYLVIQNEQDFVKFSFKMPEVKEISHKCLNPHILNVLSNFIDNETKIMIGAGDIRGAISRLGGGMTNESNLFEIVSRKQKEKLNQAKFSLSFWEKRPNSQKEIEIWSKKVVELEKMIKELEDKYKNVLQEDCSICYNTIKDPVLTPCCQNVFCGGCIMTWFETTKNCPMCRALVNVKDIVYIKKEENNNSDEKREEIKVIKPQTKPETVRDILNDGLKNNKKFLIFSSYDESFYHIRRELLASNIDYVEISGSKAVRDSKIKKFKDGKVNVVFLNSKFNGAGINLEMATDIILYHEMDQPTREQVIGRALRIGRKTDLTIHNLIF